MLNAFREAPPLRSQSQRRRPSRKTSDPGLQSACRADAHGADCARRSPQESAILRTASNRKCTTSLYFWNCAEIRSSQDDQLATRQSIKQALSLLRQWITCRTCHSSSAHASAAMHCCPAAWQSKYFDFLWLNLRIAIWNFCEFASIASFACVEPIPLPSETKPAAHCEVEWHRYCTTTGDPPRLTG